MSLSSFVSAVTLATAYAAVSRRFGPRWAAVDDAPLGPLGVSEADIVRDLAASFESREG